MSRILFRLSFLFPLLLLLLLIMFCEWAQANPSFIQDFILIYPNSATMDSFEFKSTNQPNQMILLLLHFQKLAAIF